MWRLAAQGTEAGATKAKAESEHYFNHRGWQVSAHHYCQQNGEIEGALHGGQQFILGGSG